MKIVVVGAGAIGGSLCGWIAPYYDWVYLLARGKTAEAIQANGITLFKGGSKARRQNVPVKVISDLGDAPDADVVILAVKSYSLETVAQTVREKLGEGPLIIGLQNGVENQAILPRYFPRVTYGIAGYNAWVEEPGVIGFQKRGPFVLGTPANDLQPEMTEMAKVLSLGVKTVVTKRLQDAAHSKLVLNLTNSLTTLVGHTYRPVSSPAILQTILSNLIFEGIQIVKAAGYKECRIGGMPSWLLITASAKLPQLVTRGLFKRNLKKMVISSMAQDIVERRGQQSELETINGYLLSLAGKHELEVPYNRAVYRICKEAFSQPVFEFMEVDEVWRRIHEKK